MGEARNRFLMENALIGATMPSHEQMAKMERTAALLADAIYGEGQKLDAPDKRQAMKMLAFMSCARVMAKFAEEEKLSLDDAQAWASKGMGAAIRLSMRLNATIAARKLALNPERT